MAGGVGVSVEPNKNYPGTLTWYAFWACFIGAWGGLIFGYDLGISGGVTSMTPFLKKFFPKVYMKEIGNKSVNQYCTFDSEALTLFTSSLYLAALLSSLFASKFTKRYGRKRSMLIGGVIFLFGAILNGAAVNLAMLIVGRILLGLGIGFSNQSVPLYLSEMAPYKHRGALNNGFQLSITIGILAANLINYFTDKIEGGWGWRVSLGGAAVPAVCVCIFLGGLFLPDTPNSIIERENPKEAKVVLKKIRGTDDVDQEYNDILAASEASKKNDDPWGRLLKKRKYRPHLTMAILIPFFQQFTGMNVVMFYAPVLFKTLGFKNDAALMSAVITGGVNMMATFVSIYFVDKAGRRFFFLEGGVQMVLSQVVVGGLIWKLIGVDGIGTISEGYAALVVAFICIFVAGFAWSWGPLGWLVPSEIFPLEVRPAAQSINVAVNMLFTFVIAQIFLKMLCVMKFGLFFFFGGFVIIITIFVAFFMPETKGIPIEEMSQVWKNHWFWKRFIDDDRDYELEDKSGTNIV
ncbi:hypothetical protein AQUCO_01300467v1 [Aquilegia coerulea]|uniref:Major facilitator superfamily (MFS) profile domain-containing protein n=1 Tax=Aquilegia coerulea TaxID=218851 RepID=A0A2G5E1W6_AQUCA|nr:hypothetical protein AQUCO_01300467v1 [Aquilegia coerulea]